MTKQAHGEWWFAEGSQPGTTRVCWAYAFESRTLLGYPALWLVGGVLWGGYIQRALDRALAISTAAGGTAAP